MTKRYSRITGMIGCLLLLMATALPAESQSISITAPASGGVIAPNTTFTFQVAMTGSPTGVVYWVDNWSWIGESDAAPYSLSWSNNLAVGDHILKARALFADGSSVDATDVSFTVGTEGIAVTGVSFSPAHVSLGVGATTTLTPVFVPANASNQNVSWSSSDGNVATVSDAGLVTAVAEGPATITVTTQDGAFTAASVVTVQAAAAFQTLNPTDDRDAQSDGVAGTNAIINTSQWNTAFFRFDLSSAPVNVSSVKLRLYKGPSASGSMTMNIQYTTTDAWTESGAVPTVGNAIVASSVPDAEGYVEFDVTAAVQSRLQTNRLISFAVNTDAGGWTTLNARESAANKPELVMAQGNGNTIPVSGVTVSPDSVTVPVGGTASVMAAVEPEDASNTTLTWGSDNSAVATVSSSGLVTGVSSGNAFIIATTADGSKKDSAVVTVTDTATVAANMRIGVNFWNISWEGWADYFKSGVNWNYTTNPWNPALLKDLAPFSGPIRYMDFDNTNGSTIVDWSDRIQKTADHYNTPSVAYEWMIDLCNRTGKDMWVCVPTYSNPDYWTKLATLIRNNLHSNLKCYVEYSNETWNGGFQQFQYCLDQGQALGLPGSNEYYQGGAFSVFRSLQIFQAFQDVFGATAMGNRIVRVCSFSGNFDIADQAFANVLSSSAWNPGNQHVDIAAIAPYIGPNDAGGGVMDGAESNIAARFRANVDWNYVHYIRPAMALAKKYGMKLGCYEGGQQLTTNAGSWSSNPAIYDEYVYMLNKWKPANFVLFNHYTLYGVYASGGAWGAKSDANQTTENSPKYRALTDWMQTNPAPADSVDNDPLKTIISEIIKGLANLNFFDVRVYPNPVFSGDLHVKLKADYNQSVIIRLINIKGQVIRNQAVQAATGQNNFTVDLQGVGKGVYFVAVLVNGRPYVREVLVW